MGMYMKRCSRRYLSTYPVFVRTYVGSNSATLRYCTARLTNTGVAIASRSRMQADPSRGPRSGATLQMYRHTAPPDNRDGKLTGQTTRGSDSSSTQPYRASGLVACSINNCVSWTLLFPKRVIVTQRMISRRRRRTPMPPVHRWHLTDMLDMARRLVFISLALGPVQHSVANERRRRRRRRYKTGEYRHATLRHEHCGGGIDSSYAQKLVLDGGLMRSFRSDLSDPVAAPLRMATFESATTSWQLLTRQRLGGLSHIERWQNTIYLDPVSTQFGRIIQ
jgi:hypothetical protein